MKDALQVIIDGLTYEGQVLHIIINYALIILAVMPFLFFNVRAPRKNSSAWVGYLVIAVFIQVAVWFAARAIRVSVVGVSLIWCIMMGYLLVDYSKGNLGRTGHMRGLVLIALGSGCGGIVYYMVAFPAITTISHLVAVSVGVSLFYLIQLVAKKKTSQK
jgi:hypothetical protein